MYIYTVEPLLTDSLNRRNLSNADNFHWSQIFPYYLYTTKPLKAEPLYSVLRTITCTSHRFSQCINAPLRMDT